jgi:hypothetical protein
VIIGKQTSDDSEFLVYDEDPLVRVTISEVPCEFNYSNPTGLFNLSIPHVELRLNMYSTLSYKQQKKNDYDEERKARLEKAQADKEAGVPAEFSKDEEELKEAQDPQEDQGKMEVDEEPPALVEDVPPELILRDWFTCKRNGPILLRVCVTNRQKLKVKFRLQIESADGSDPNVILPQSVVKDSFYDADTKCILHL